MLDISSNSTTRTQQRRVRNAFLMAVSILIIGALSAGRCAAQTDGSDTDQGQYEYQQYQQSQQSQQYPGMDQGQDSDQQSIPYTDQQSTPNSSQQYAPYSNQQSTPYSNQQYAPYSNQQNVPYTNQQNTLYPCTNQQNAPYADQQNMPYSGQESGQTSNQQYPSQLNGQGQYQQGTQLNQQMPCLMQNQQPRQQATEALQPQPDLYALSGDQVISILTKAPMVLESVRTEYGLRNNLKDLRGVTDEVVYGQIRQDPSFRELVIRELIRRGFRADLAALAESLPVVDNRIKPYKNPDNPQVLKRESPYGNMPSLDDLYAQFSEKQEKLRRFGSEAFLNGTGNANRLPMDLPAGPDYVLGPGDSLTVNLWGSQSNRLSRVIDRQGQIDLPEIGAVMISGVSIAQAQVVLQKALDTQFKGEHVEISLGRVRTVRIYVVGDVQRPGAYDVSSLSTPLSALFSAGGPTDHGSLRVLRQYRGGQLVRQVDLYDFFLHGVRSNDERLLPGDTILVPPVGPQVTVEGSVRRPAVYELNGEQDLQQVVDLAGGLLASANLRQIDVERIDVHQTRSMFSLQLGDDPQAEQQRMAAFTVKDGDDVRITQIHPYNEQAVYLDGHVFHPGKFPYREGMTVGDLLHSYQDLMPEPADHGEIVRLLPPDFRPETISFNVPDVLMGNGSILLRPYDLVRVFGRYEADSPSVTIDGDVLRPGKYPMSQGMTASDLLMMAGGFRRSADHEFADLSTYTIQGEQKVLVGHSEIPIQKVLDGDKSADAVLKPGDVFSIRRLSGWQDIGSTVTLTGEVEHAGTYGITPGEHLSTVLKRAGGFRGDAYPYAAVLQRRQVMQLNEQARRLMIRRLEETPVIVSPSTLTSNETAQDLQKSLEAQRAEMIENLRSTPPNGRLVINISTDISNWENTPADVPLNAGDTLFVPKRPDFVMASGQVYNPVAISYVPGKKLGWYYNKSGGATSSGNKHQIYVLRADGSVVPCGKGWFDNSYLKLRMRPGDTIFVPEKSIGGSQVFQDLIGSAQLLTSAMLPLAVAGVL